MQFLILILVVIMVMGGGYVGVESIFEYDPQGGIGSTVHGLEISTSLAKCEAEFQSQTTYQATHREIYGDPDPVKSFFRRLPLADKGPFQAYIWCEGDYAYVLEFKTQRFLSGLYLWRMTRWSRQYDHPNLFEMTGCDPEEYLYSNVAERFIYPSDLVHHSYEKFVTEPWDADIRFVHRGNGERPSIVIDPNADRLPPQPDPSEHLRRLVAIDPDEDRLPELARQESIQLPLSESPHHHREW